MKENNEIASTSAKSTAILLLICLIAIIYSNTLQATWALDDYSNIVYNPHLKTQITDKTTLIESLRFDGRLNRPVSRMTLVLNWNLGQDNVTGYRLVNIFIHILTAIMLYLTVIQLCRTPKLRSLYEPYSQAAALITAVLWAAHPIQIQAVTYIVQRMASMAALFYICAIFFYLKARLTGSSSFIKILYFSACVLCFLLGVGSKENAFTLPLALILVEFLFIQPPSELKKRQYLFMLITGAVICLILIVSMLYLNRNPFAMLLSQAPDREFSPLERILTQFRVLIFYISQIIYPLSSRFSIEHDMELSVSLFSPWQTFPSLIIIFLLIAVGVMQRKKRPVLSFAILFYFLGHSIESLVSSLELVFEHRNYLPTLFLFFPVSIGLLRLIDRYPEKRIVYAGAYLMLCISVITLGFSTYLRNEVWATSKILLEDAIKKAPQSARPYSRLAWTYYEKIGQYNIAMQLNRHAANLAFNRKWGNVTIYHNAGVVHYRLGDYDTAINYFNTAISIKPDIPIIKYGLASAECFRGHSESSMTVLDSLIEQHPNYSDALMLKGFLFLKQGQVETALAYFQRSIKAGGNNEYLMLNIGSALIQLGLPEKGMHFYRHGYHLFPKEHLFLFYLIEANIKIGDDQRAGHYADQLLARVPLSEIQRLYNRIFSRHIVPVDKSLVYPVLQDRVAKMII